ncbi:MAG: metallophosphoesterase [Thermodesulfobacteriota bacterium]|nr:metallophosphoesterase [Thermodesulfobacteriota bacterium]
MIFFYLVILSVFLATQSLGLLIWRRRLISRPRFRLAVTCLFAGANLPWLYFFYAVAKPGLPPGWVTVLIIRPFLTWQFGLLIWLAVLWVLTILSLLVFSLPRLAFRRRRNIEERPGQDEPANPGRRVFLVQTARAAVWGGIAAGTGWGLVRSGAAPRVVTHDLAFDHLPRTLDGLKIAHLSDLHIGLWTSAEEVAQAFDLTRQLKPDLVVITGDIIDHNPNFSRVFIRYSDLPAEAPLGVFGIIGNHDVYTGANAVTEALESGGLVMLRDRHHSFKPQGLPLALIGVDDSGRHWTGSGGPLPLDQAMTGLPKDIFPIFLTHRPTGFEQAKAMGIPLTLCGHTHGGQFAIPGGPNLADLAYKYTHGLYREPEGLLHVSAGLGSVGLPFRLGVSPEITLLRLTASSA